MEQRNTNNSSENGEGRVPIRLFTSLSQEPASVWAPEGEEPLDEIGEHLFILKANAHELRSVFLGVATVMAAGSLCIIVKYADQIESALNGIMAGN